MYPNSNPWPAAIERVWLAPPLRMQDFECRLAASVVTGSSRLLDLAETSWALSQAHRATPPTPEV